MLALPPVVNAIMAQAAEQADTSWLRDQDFDGDPETDDPPPFQLNPGNQSPPEQQPPPDERDRPPQPVCVQYREPAERTLSDGISRPIGELPLVLRGDDRGLLAFIHGTQVTGTPQFILARDGDTIWTYPARQSLNEAVDEQPQEQEMEAARAPEEWTLSWDLSRVIYERFELSLETFRCEVPSDG